MFILFLITADFSVFRDLGREDLKILKLKKNLITLILKTTTVTLIIWVLYLESITVFFLL